ncbi:hypothetical protein [Flavobacterium gelatinilyticum]|uniref:FEKKY domain-containing protein n=1 Tax=Flavobacterium gelatinilyticum TaxID=3003260 RepID=UPI00247FD618|nr:hypothetical protein [Flavobacterium gelatinilyticum]
MKKAILILSIVFFNCKSQDIPLVTEYKNQALHDVEVDSVKKFTYGLRFIAPSEAERKIQLKKEHKRDSVYKKYGLFLRNEGCVIGDKKLNEAISAYHKITDSYLENRNGKGWKEKMEQELSKY